MLNKEEIRKKGYDFVDYCLEGKRALGEDVAAICFSAELVDNCSRTLLRNEGYNIEILKQPKIKVGDIYKDMDDGFIYIFQSSENQGLFGGVFYGQLIGGREKRKYNQDGVCCLFADLDLSRKYEISEIENE